MACVVPDWPNLNFSYCGACICSAATWVSRKRPGVVSRRAPFPTTCGYTTRHAETRMTRVEVEQAMHAGTWLVCGRNLVTVDRMYPSEHYVRVKGPERHHVIGINILRVATPNDLLTL